MWKLSTAYNISTTTGSRPHAVRHSAVSEDQQVRSRRLVQVQSPISTTYQLSSSGKKEFVGRDANRFFR